MKSKIKPSGYSQSLNQCSIKYCNSVGLFLESVSLEGIILCLIFSNTDNGGLHSPPRENLFIH